MTSRPQRGTDSDRVHLRQMTSHFVADYERRRRQDVALPPDQTDRSEIAPIQLDVADFYCQQNAQEHHTEMFEVVQDDPPTPVFRRGLSFYLAFRFDRPLDLQRDIVKLIFDFGPHPAITRGTRAILVLRETSGLTDKSSWNVEINSLNQNDVTVQVQLPVNCPVGIWHCTLNTARDLDPRNTAEFKIQDDIYVLFNPWLPEDPVFMYDEKNREEYVLKDSGKVWMGSYRAPKGRQWIFGQFDDVVLPTTMLLLELSGLAHKDRGNPILVARAISAVINADDEGGLMIGRWDGDYSDGTAPQAWTGSVAIMEEFMSRGAEPVSYGQCWVFSGLIVTVCRALGIPCRSVTNYVSAHDTNSSLTVDKYFDRNGSEIPGGPDGDCNDSCWNFHVWNDLWMTRPDLPSGYGGWQVIDATPQEESEGQMRCGPASVEAVKRGKVSFLYDTPFVFSEVNADVCHFQEDDASDWGFSRLRINKYHVGRKIVTKAVGLDDLEGDSDMWDITDYFKNPEGSNEERLAVFEAVRGFDSAQKYYDYPDKEKQDVDFDLIDIDDINYGDPFKMIVKIKNNSENIRTIQAVLTASSVYYTGVTIKVLKRAEGSFTVPPRGTESLMVTVSSSDYLGQLIDQSLIKIYAIANVSETGQTWSEEDDFPLIKPSLEVQVSGSLKVGERCSARFLFRNPLNLKLTECSFSVEGPGLQRPKTIRFRDVGPQEKVVFTEYFQPRKSGERKILGTFNSKELSGLNGASSVVIRD